MPSGGIGGRSGASSCLDCDCVPVFVCELVPDCPDSLVLEAVPVFEPPLLLFDPVPFLLCEPVPLFDPPFLLWEPVPVFVFEPVRLRLSEIQSEAACACGTPGIMTWPVALAVASAAA